MDFERSFVKITLAAITAVTIGNMVVNWKGTVETGKVVLGFPVALVQALRR
jgi:hypothetical protein